MTLRKTFAALAVQLNEMLRVVSELQRFIRDEPVDGSALAQRFEYAADDMHGWAEEALAALDPVAPAGLPSDVEPARAALVSSHQLTLELTQRLDGLLTYENVRELIGFGQERGDAWLKWAKNVHIRMKRCRPPLVAVHQALLECWQELAERAALQSVSVQATNIGQQVALPTELVPEGLT